MSVHNHTVRTLCANALGLVLALFLFGWFLATGSKDFALAQVSGRVTCGGQPFSGAIYFLPEGDGVASAIGPVKSDGSFQLYINGDWDRRGAVPGTYRVVLRPQGASETESRAEGKYERAQTSDLLIDVGPDWNDLRLNLH